MDRLYLLFLRLFIFLFFLLALDAVFFFCPCAEVYELAPLRAERPERVFFPGRDLLA